MREKFSKSALVMGQLQTPLTNYANWGGVWAADNGAFSGFDLAAWQSMLDRKEPHRADCLFVALPDVVAAARRTLEVFERMRSRAEGWPLALVGQDGLESLDVPWDEFHALFVGGSTEWKMSQSAADLVRTAKILGKHVHIGRVNTFDRWRHFHKLGADTCDGTGVVKYDHMLRNIEQFIRDGDEPRPLLEACS